MPDGLESALRKLNEDYPFLRRLVLRPNGDGASVEPLLPIQKTLFKLGLEVGSQSKEHASAIVVLPKRHDLAMWTAVLYGLARMKSDYEAAIVGPPRISPGDLVLLDGRWVASYHGEEVISKRSYLKLGFGGDNAFRYYNPEERLRIQPCTTRRALTPVKRPELGRKPTQDVLDLLLGIQAYGNLSIYRPHVLLVGTVSRILHATSTYMMDNVEAGAVEVRSTKLLDLLPWANVAETGSTNRWGSQILLGPPVIAVSSTLESAAEFLRTDAGELISLVVLDGATSYSSEVHAIDELKDNGRGILAVLEHSDLESLKPLQDRGFRLISWSRKEIRSTIDNDNNSTKNDTRFAAVQGALRNFAHFKLIRHSCKDGILTAASSRLVELDLSLREKQSIFRESLWQFYDCLLQAARLTYPCFTADAEPAWVHRYDAKLDRLGQEIEKNKIWLGSDLKLTRALFDDLTNAPRALTNAVGGKIAAGPDLLSKICAGGKRVAFLVAHLEEVGPTKKHIGALVTDPTALSVCTASTLDTSQQYDAIVPSGWLGWEKMRDLWDAHIAPEFHLLLYSFEEDWCNSAAAKWERTREPQCDRDYRTSLLGDLAPDDQSGIEAVADEEQTSCADISEFELRLRAYRRNGLVRDASSHEKSIEARYVEFSEGYFAFISESHRLRVVTEYLLGRARADSEIPTKLVGELKSGDFVVIRETGGGDVIRAMADKGLDEAGFKGLRNTAHLWKDALISKLTDCPRGQTELVEWLRLHGCKRHEGTVRRWIRDDPEDYQIGPSQEDDLRCIASATKNPVLNGRLDEVWRAIKRVRSAHLQASGHLVDLLLKQVPKHLGEVTGGAFPIDVEAIGRAWILRVENVAPQDSPIAVSKVNRLLSGE
jgi:hypothetical protein